MEKTSTLNLRINPEVKQQAEEILHILGIPMSTAVDMYFKQIILTGGIPFPLTIPKFPKSINSEEMTDPVLNEKLQKGYNDALSGRTENASEAFERFRREHL